jgi:hypothetical protein
MKNSIPEKADGLTNLYSVKDILSIEKRALPTSSFSVTKQE